MLIRYFTTAKYSSFARQMSHYGFARIPTGPNQGGFFHEYFLRGRPDLTGFVHRRTLSSRKSSSTRLKRRKQLKLPPNLSLYTPCRPLNSNQIMKLCVDPVCQPSKVFAFPAEVRKAGKWDPASAKYCVQGGSCFNTSNPKTQGSTNTSSPTPKWTEILPQGIGGWDWLSFNPSHDHSRELDSLMDRRDGLR